MRTRSSELKASKQTVSSQQAHQETLHLAERFLQRFLGWFFDIFLRTFNEAQDALLAITPFRRLVAFALAPKCLATVNARIKDGAKLQAFDELQYYVSAETKELLVHSGMHALLQPPSSFQKGVPDIGRILLQSDSAGCSKYSEAIAGSLAHELKASLLVVDDSLRSGVSRDLLGNGLWSSESLDSSFWAYLLSFWLSGGKVAFVWDVLQRICAKTGSGNAAESKPLVVLIKDAEKAICSSNDSCEAFTQAFGDLDSSLFSVKRKRVMTQSRRVILIATAKIEDPKPKQSNGLRSALEKMTQDTKSGGSGADDLASILFPELSLMAAEDKPNPKRMLERLFMTHICLKVPTGTPAAEKHKLQLEKDAADERESQNQLELTLLGVDGSSLEKASDLLRPQQLSHSDWSKVVTWARAMEACIQVKAVTSNEEIAEAEMISRLPDKSPRSDSAMRRSASAMSSANSPMDDMPAMVKNIKLRKGKTSKSAESALLGGVPLSERSLAYGLRMLRTAKGKSSSSVKTENSYEKNLLKEVVSPEDAGNGFAEVGALGPVKDVLREVVQFPLQYPEIFAAGSLAALSRGVLLFGPPGTGKTMLARAVAAECGASFLAIHPSAVASKWLGDGVRYIKAAFSLAQKMAPCVIFLDEVDALLSRRNSHHEHEALREMKNEAMAQWDGIRQDKSAGDRVIVLGATNRPQDLDDAVLRRFSRRIFCDMPDRKAREAILKVILAKDRLADDVDLSKVANKTDGYTGSDLRQVCTNAAMRPVRDLLQATGKEAKLKAKAEEQRTSESLVKDTKLTNGHSQHPPLSKRESGHGIKSATSAHSKQLSNENKEDRAEASSSSVERDLPDECKDNLDSALRASDAATETACSPSHENLKQLGSEGASLHSPASSSTSASDLELLLEISQSAEDVTSESRKRKLNSEERVCQRCKGQMASLAQDALVWDQEKIKLMDRLLTDCDRMADTSKKMQQNALRPISAKDLEEAIKQTAPSTDKDSYSMDELRTWNSTYGEGKDTAYRNPKLTYFI